MRRIWRVAGRPEKGGLLGREGWTPMQLSFLPVLEVMMTGVQHMLERSYDA